MENWHPPRLIWMEGEWKGCNRHTPAVKFRDECSVRDKKIKKRMFLGGFQDCLPSCSLSLSVLSSPFLPSRPKSKEQTQIAHVYFRLIAFSLSAGTKKVLLWKENGHCFHWYRYCLCSYIQDTNTACINGIFLVDVNLLLDWNEKSTVNCAFDLLSKQACV